MLAHLILPALTLILSCLPSTKAIATNFTLRAIEKRTSSTQSGWTKERCATVAGTYCGYKYNFGCLCLSDLDDFCGDNSINSYIQSLIVDYVSTPPLIPADLVD